MILNYYEKGNKNDPTVVFIHGSASDATVWLNELSIVASHGYHCLALDLRGHGDTRLMAQPKEHLKIDIESHVHDVYETLNHIDVFHSHKQVVIVTHSFGGIVALNLAERHPEIIQKLIMIAMPPKLVSPTKDFLKVLLGKPLEIIQSNLDLIQKSPLRARYKSSILTNAHVLQEIYKHVRNWNGFKRITHINCRVYFAAGRFDIVAPAPLMYKMHQFAKNSSFELFKWSGHALMEDEPEKFQSWLLKCIGEKLNDSSHPKPEEHISQHN